LTGLVPMAGFQRDPDPAFGVVGLVNGVVDPPRTVVVPEVVVGVGGIDFDAEGGQRGLEGGGAH